MTSIPGSPMSSLQLPLGKDVILKEDRFAKIGNALRAHVPRASGRFLDAPRIIPLQFNTVLNEPFK